MSKEENVNANDQITVVPDTVSNLGAGQAPAGDGFEAPKRPRTVAQIAAFEKARAARAAKQAARKTEPERSVSPPLPSRREEPPPPLIQTRAVAPRKPRSDAGKKRGRLVRYEEEPVQEPERAGGRLSSSTVPIFYYRLRTNEAAALPRIQVRIRALRRIGTVLAP